MRDRSGDVHGDQWRTHQPACVFRVGGGDPELGIEHHVAGRGRQVTEQRAAQL
jgi:hypothetical protein